MTGGRTERRGSTVICAGIGLICPWRGGEQEAGLQEATLVLGSAVIPSPLLGAPGGTEAVGQPDAEVTPCSAAAAAARLPPPLETFILNISEFVTSSGARGRMCWSETLYNFIQRFR